MAGVSNPICHVPIYDRALRRRASGRVNIMQKPGTIHPFELGGLQYSPKQIAVNGQGSNQRNIEDTGRSGGGLRGAPNPAGYAVSRGP